MMMMIMKKKEKTRSVALVTVGNKKKTGGKDEKVTSMRLILTCESYFAVGFFFSFSI